MAFLGGLKKRFAPKSAGDSPLSSLRAPSGPPSGQGSPPKRSGGFFAGPKMAGGAKLAVGSGQNRGGWVSRVVRAAGSILIDFGASREPKSPAMSGMASLGDKLRQRRKAGAGGFGWGRRPPSV